MAVREDLPPGLQAAQAVHAAIGFALTFPSFVPETVIVVACPDEPALAWLCSEAGRGILRHFPVHEPDLGGSLTAVAIEPAGARLCRGLPLLLKGVPV